MNLSRFRQRVPEILFSVIGVALVIRLIRLCISTSSDFEVYWYAVHAWVSGQNPYSRYSPVFTGLVFKYPPWVIPLFLPFAWCNLGLAKAIWTIAQILAIFYSMRWLVIQGVNRRVVLLVSLMFWYMWLAHVYFGQITVFLLAIALWAVQMPNRHFSQSSKFAILTYTFTSKIFSMISLVGLPLIATSKPIAYKKTIYFGILLILVAHGLLIFSYGKSVPIGEQISELGQLYKEWAHAASSGGAELGESIVRGPQNHGFVAAILRIAKIPATQVSYDVSVALILCLSFCLLWIRFSKNLTPNEKWAGWLAMGVIAHPLAWHHSFVMAFPLCAFSLHRAVESKNKYSLGLPLFGISLIGLFVPQVIGTNAVIPLEYVGSKSWGVILCAIALVRAEIRSPRVAPQSSGVPAHVL